MQHYSHWPFFKITARVDDVGLLVVLVAVKSLNMHKLFIKYPLGDSNSGMAESDSLIESEL